MVACRGIFVSSLGLTICFTLTKGTAEIDYFFRVNQTYSEVANEFFPNQPIYESAVYRVAFPDPEDYVIDMLVNPCGVNGTFENVDPTTPHGYDCCMNQFGRGEYGFLKYHESYQRGESAIEFTTASEKRLLADPEEVMHNVYLVDEAGLAIPYEESRRADDFLIIDESCDGLRSPDSSCFMNRVRAVTSPLVPPCWDHNQTVNALLDCFTPDGESSSHCMQISYSQNAYIHICNGDFADDDTCGTFIEIHMPNGSPYDRSETILSNRKLLTRKTNGMYTVTISLRYKDDLKRVLCAYKEAKIRIGSIVLVSDKSPQCCCPPSYNENIQTGSFFCPRKRITRGGPFADRIETFADLLMHEEDMAKYPFCGAVPSDRDILMCSRETGGWLPTHKKRDPRTGIEYMGSGYFYSEPCDAIKEKHGQGSEYWSSQLEGVYINKCPLGEAFISCALRPEAGCYGGDSNHKFAGESGKVVSVPLDQDSKTALYGVTFNDGRTVYQFPKYVLELINPISNYELWFVQRNRFERIVLRKKGFRVVWPRCTFDTINDQYLPFALISNTGHLIELSHEKLII